MKTILLITMLLLGVPSLAQTGSYTFVFLNHKPEAEQISKEQSAKIMEGHMANINRLAKEGKLVVAGPFDGGGGVFILKTNSIDDAREWLSTDPGVQANRWNIELLPYTPRVGGACPVQEPYEMTSYSFVRFAAIVSKSTAPTYPEIIRKHTAYLKTIIATGNVITEGTFGDNEGGILVMKGDVHREVIEADPGVQEGLLELTFKTLYVARGSFCEK